MNADVISSWLIRALPMPSDQVLEPEGVPVSLGKESRN